MKLIHRGFQATPELATRFLRNSTAYKQDGSAVPANQPRFELGRFHNLLINDSGKDLSSCEIDGLYVPRGTATVVRDTTKNWEGSSSYKISSALSGSGTSNAGRVKVIPGVTYNYSAHACGEVGGENWNFQIRFYNSSGGYISADAINMALTTSWQRFTKSVVIPSNAASIDISFVNTTNEAQTIYIDGLMLNEGSVPLAWQPGGTGKSIQIEEGTANIIPLANQKFVGWIAYSGVTVTLTQNQTVSEWGATDATRIQASGGTDALKYYLWFPAVNGTSYALSCWVKNNGTSVVKFMPGGNGLQHLPSVTVNPGEAKRCIIAGTAIDAGGAIRVATAGIDPVNETLDIIAWRPQIEAKPYATSWTNGTRAGEDLTLPAGLVTPAQGSIGMWVYFDANALRTTGYNGIVRVLKKSDEGVGFLFCRTSGSTTWLLETRDDTNAATRAYIDDTYFPVGWHHVFITWDTTSAKAFIDGALRATVNNPKLPTAFSRISIGCNFTSYVNAVYDDLIIYNVAKTDAEIAAIYASNAPAPIDYSTTYALDFDGDLLPKFYDARGKYRASRSVAI
jgi:hypothetical protein